MGFKVTKGTNKAADQNFGTNTDNTKKSHFTPQLILSITALSILGVVVLFFIVNTIVRNIVHDRIISISERDVTIQAQEVDAWFLQYRNLVEYMATTWGVVGVEPGVTGFGPDPIGERFLEQSDALVALYVGFENGWHVNSRGWIPPEGFHAPDHPWYYIPEAAGGEVAITLPYVRLIDGDIVASMGAWRENINGMAAVVAVDILLQDVIDMLVLTQYETAADGFLLLVGPGNEIIVHGNRRYMLSPYQEAWNMRNINHGELLMQSIQSGEPVSYEHHLFGQVYFFSVPLSTVNWTLGAIVPMAPAEAQVTQYLITVMLTLAAFLITFLIISLMIAVRFLRYVRTKERKAEAKVRERLQVMLNSSPYSCTAYDVDGNALEANRATIELFGLSDAQEYLDNFHKLSPEYQPDGTHSATIIVENLKKMVATGEPMTYHNWMNQTIDGEPLPVDVTLVPVEVDGETRIIAYKLDLRSFLKAKELENAEHQRVIEHQRAEAAEENNRIKDRFLARMSHEIRTPITAVLGISEIELRRQSHEKDAAEPFAKIYNSAKGLLGIVNDILDISKIEGGNLEIAHAEYKTGSMIDDFTHLRHVYMADKDIDFRLSVDENIPSALIGDALRIRQIVNNLLSNAFKYTETGSVTLSIKWEDGKLVISIRDTGLGMSPEQQQSIFVEYTRFHEHQLHTIGTGLGMAIARSLIQNMGGEIELESEVGKGTHVLVSIPQEIADSQPLGRELTQNFKRLEQDTHIDDTLLEPKPEQMPYGKVLVVDDVETNLYVTKTMLETFGVSVELCTSGKETLDKIEQDNIYDIIFLDHMMPEMDGIEVVKILRKNGYNYPIVALTANAVKGQVEFFMKSGFTEFMSKPIDFKVMRSLLVRFVKDRHEK